MIRENPEASVGFLDTLSGMIGIRSVELLCVLLILNRFLSGIIIATLNCRVIYG
ncbi:MAG: hypothetical protein FD164_1749 [Nitrospirae bacterium]|nr:MAG: hypothetical protein FD164_1749 [Nitrospirota bacterium]